MTKLSPEEEQIKEAIRHTFNTVADAYGSGACRFFHISGKNMAKLHELNGNEHILDLASGTGASVIPLAKRLDKGKVTGIDFSIGMLAQAREYANQEGVSNIDLHVQDMTALPFPDNHFDHANCAFGLFFIEDLNKLLSHITAKVKPGGRVMISGFCGDSFMPQSDLALNKLRDYGLEVPEQPYGWKRMAEPQQLQELYESANLKDVNITRKSIGYYTTPEGWWEVIWNAGFRGLVAQLGDRLEEFKQEHLKEVETLVDDKGLWLEIDVNYTQGVKA